MIDDPEERDRRIRDGLKDLVQAGGKRHLDRVAQDGRATDFSTGSSPT